MATTRPLLPLLLLLLLFLSVSVAVAVVADRKPPLVGAWGPIKDIEDSHIQELAKWAVSEHNKRAHSVLLYRRVVSGDEQVVSGMNYQLVIEAAKDHGKTAAYKAAIYEQVWTNSRELTSFDEAK